MKEPEGPDFRPAAESSKTWIVVLVLALAVGAGVAWWRWSTPTPASVEQAAAPAAAPTDGPAPAPAPAPVASGPQFPIDAQANAPAEPLPALANADRQVEAALAGLLGRPSVLQFLQVDGFVRRFVATVDNLPREHAASRLWPVVPAPRRFEVADAGDAKRIAADNAARYAPFIAFAEGVDTGKAVALYARLYPLFQQAYEEQGYPGRYFNDRLVAVIDHLLQTPEPTGPLAVKLTVVKGSVPAAQPWLRYEFADPALESLSAGQKLMLRMGLDNERRLKLKLTDLRRQLATGAVPAPPRPGSGPSKAN